MKKINNFIEKNIETIINLFIIIQPILDVITALSINYLKINITIGAIIRMTFLLIHVYYLIFLNKTKNKKTRITYLLLFLIYLIIFSTIQLTYKDINAYKYEIKNTINTFYLPIIIISLLDMFEQYKIKFKIKSLLITYILYIILIIFPNITNTSFLSYSHSKLGNIGWFLSANGVGNILSILLPIIFIHLLKIKQNILIKILIIISTIYVFSSMGTKVPILSLGICTIGTFLYYFIKWIKTKKYTNIIISIILTTIILIFSITFLPKTSFYKNLEIHKNYLGLNSYYEVFTKYELIDHFIFSQRLTFLKNTNQNYQKASLLEKFFGIGYIENYKTTQESIKTIEIDYFEIFYRNGIIGTILYLYIFIPILIDIFKKTKKTSIINAEYKIIIILIGLLSLFSGHVLVAPPISIFVALILTIISKGDFYEKIS